jgi:hypothetical protein
MAQKYANQLDKSNYLLAIPCSALNYFNIKETFKRSLKRYLNPFSD